MNTIQQSVVPVILAGLLGAGAGAAWAQSGPSANSAAAETIVLAVAAGTVGAGDAASEPVVFSGQASISGKVIRDTVFGAPPVLEILVDLSNVRGRGMRTGKSYLVAGHTVLHRPLLAFDPVEVTFSYAADGNLLLARSALASFGVYYSAGKGMTTSAVRILPNRPS